MMRPAQGMWTSSCADNQRRPLVPGLRRGRLHEVSLRGTDRIAIDAARADFLPPAPLDGIVDANHHGGVRAQEAGDQQTQQPACHGAGRPHGPAEHAMVDREVGLLLAPKNTQCRRDGSLARRQDGACHQQQDILPGRAGKQLGQVGQPRLQAFRQRGLAGWRNGIGLFHPMRRIDSTESRQALARPAAQEWADWLS